MFKFFNSFLANLITKMTNFTLELKRNIRNDLFFRMFLTSVDLYRKQIYL